MRRGYRPTPFWSKVLFRYNLLCDNCNWEFTGFAVPGTVSAKPTKNPKKKPVDKPNERLKNSSNNSENHLPKRFAENPISPGNLEVKAAEADEINVVGSESGKVEKVKKKNKRKSGV